MQHTRRKRWRILIVAVILLIGCGWWQFEVRLRPIVESYGQNSTRSVVTRLVNEAVTAQLADTTTEEPLLHLERDSEGTVTLLEIDATGANALKLRITKAVLSALNQSDMHTLRIPLGTLFGSDLLSGRGPSIPIRVSHNHSVTTELTGEWRSEGINQTAHTLTLRVQVKTVSALAGGRRISQEVEYAFLVTETILVGKVPDTFASLTPNGE